MTDRPIIFSAPMVRALLDGRKTMTRRMAWKIEPCPQSVCPFKEPRRLIDLEGKTCESCPRWHQQGGGVPSPWQKVKPGDRLWVRETFKLVGGGDPGTPIYRANWREDALARGLDNIPTEEPKQWRTSIHMPRWASRMMLEVKKTKVEPLQEISEEDAKAEGISAHATAKECRDGALSWGEVPTGTPDDAIYWLADYTTKGDADYPITLDPRRSFQGLWDSIHGAGAWDNNPEAVVISFNVWLYNIDRPTTVRPLLARVGK